MNRIPVAIHLQDDRDKCGQACAQMITRALAAQLQPQTAFTSKKKGLWASGSTPDQLADMLNQFPRAGPLQYKAFADEDADDAIERLRACVNHAGDRYPGVALIHDGDHWEVVHGFTESTDTHDSIHLRNPLPERDGLSPPLRFPHSDGDDCDLQNQTSPGGAPEDEAMTIAEWKADYFGKCKFEPAKYHHRFVVVAPDVPLLKRHEKHEREHRRKLPKPLDGLQVTQAAIDGLSRSALLGQPDWSGVLTGVRSDLAQPFLSVERLNRSGSYILVVLRNDASAACVVGIDGDSGEFLFARLNPADRIVASLTQRIDSVVHAADPNGHDARVVWAPARNTFFSPYFPVVEFTDHTGQRAYVRLFDGKRFRSLDDPTPW